MLNGKTGGSGGNHVLPNIDCNIHKGAIKEASNAKNSFDSRTIPESTNEYLVKANMWSELKTDAETLTYIYIYIYVYIYIYIYIHIYAYIYIYPCIDLSIYIYLSIYIHTHIHIYIYIYVSESSRNRRQWSPLKAEAETLTQNRMPTQSATGSADMPIAAAVSRTMRRRLKPAAGASLRSSHLLAFTDGL